MSETVYIETLTIADLVEYVATKQTHRCIGLNQSLLENANAGCCSMQRDQRGKCDRLLDSNSPYEKGAIAPVDL